MEILRQIKGSEVDPLSLNALDADNGAAKLARMLLEECTDLHLFIGKAINPAHQNPNLPMDLSIKMRLLNELADLMRAMGKNVKISVY